MKPDPDPDTDLNNSDGHKPSPGTVSPRLALFIVAVAISIFVFDLIMPLGVAAGVPYVALALTGIFLPKIRHIFMLAVLGSVLIAMGYFISPEGGIFWIVLVNRGLALFAIWLTAFLIVSRKRMENALRVSRDSLEAKIAVRTKELREREKILRDIAEITSDWFWEMDENLRFVSFSGRSNLVEEALPNTVGLTRWESAGVDPDVDPVWREHKETLEKHLPFSNFEFPLPSLTTEQLWLQVNGIPVFDEEGEFTGYRGSARDITDKKTSEDRLRFVIDNIPALIAYIGADERYQLVNETCAKWYGIRKEDIIGETITDVHGSNIEIFRSHIEKALADGADTFEIKSTYPDGVTRDVVLSYIAISDVSGDRSSFLAVGFDYSDLKRAEAQLIQSAKLASLGEMATGTAHEINQPLNIIRMAADTLTERLNEGERPSTEFIEKLLGRIVSQTKRATDIIDRMRIFGRTPVAYETDISLKEAVLGAVGFLSEQFRLIGIELRLDIPENCRRVMGDIVQLEQVIVNLLANARDAIEEKVAKAGNGPGADHVTVKIEDNPEANEIRLIIEDTGGGIPEDVLPNIFDPFLTTKVVGKGTGVGLSISYGIVTQMGGTILARNVDGGARFTITLPAVENHQ